jgi:hypothetical protein
MSKTKGRESGDASESRRARANRENAKRSTGPRTDEGKARSAANSTVHGCYATRSVAITRGSFAEDPDKVHELLESIVTDLRPRNSVEARHARTIAMLYLRLDRLERFEAVALAGTYSAEDGPHFLALGELRSRLAIADYALDMDEGEFLNCLAAAFVLIREFRFSDEQAAEIVASVDDRLADDAHRRLLDAVLEARFPDREGQADWAIEYAARNGHLIDDIQNEQVRSAQTALKEGMLQSTRIHLQIGRELERELTLYRELRKGFGDPAD